MIRHLLPLLLLLLGTACASGPTVHVRIRNDTGQDITDFWLGSGGRGGGSKAYGALPRGTTSPYREVGAELHNYRKSDFLTADGQRHLDVVYPERHVGTETLSPGGYYTFAYRLEKEGPVLTLTQEPAPARR